MVRKIVNIALLGIIIIAAGKYLDSWLFSKGLRIQIGLVDDASQVIIEGIPTMTAIPPIVEPVYYQPTMTNEQSNMADDVLNELPDEVDSRACAMAWEIVGKECTWDKCRLLFSNGGYVDMLASEAERYNVGDKGDTACPQ